MFIVRMTLPRVVVALCLLAGVPAQPQTIEANGCQQPIRQAAAPGLHQELQRLDRELDQLLERVGRTGVARGLERAEVRFEYLESELRSLPAAAAAPLRGKLDMLGNRLGDLLSAAERDGGLVPGPVAPGARSHVQTLGAPPNDDCASATVIGPGTFFGDTSEATNDGQTTCGSSLFSPDVWYKLVFPTTGTLYLNTFGSSYDTVLSVHSGCPGTVGNTVACDDDTSGLDSAVGVFGAAGQERWIRVSGFAGETGAFTLHVGGGGEIAGTVTGAATGDPLTGLRVDLWDDNGYSVGSAYTDPAGAYTLGGLAPGIYFATTWNEQGYIDELHDDLPCPGGGGYSGGCDPPDGTPILVGIDTSVTGIDFALDRGGEITGQVTDAGTGMAAAGVRVEVWNGEGSLVQSRFSDHLGAYSFEGLPAGTYFASTDTSDFADELYDDIPCPGGAPYGCDPTTGSAIAVEITATTAGIDFALDRLGAIAGTVTETPTGDPLSSVRVDVWTGTGSRLGSAYTDAAGGYSVAGLLAGTYFVVALGWYENHTDEFYDDFPCPGGPPYGCAAVAGTPVEVEVSQSVTGIDFVLDRLGVVSGTVTEAAGGDPIASLWVEIWDSDGSYVRPGRTDATGLWTVDRLRPGTYYAVTDPDNYVSELYDDLPCPGGPYDCDPTTGTPIEVELNLTVSEIDFQLVRKGIISGTVTDETTGDPIAGARVEVLNTDGYYVWGGNTDDLGVYSTSGLDSGSYYAVTDLRLSDYLDELYRDLPCGPPAGCEPTSGMPIEVADGTITASIDFTLSLGGAISGAVTDLATGEPITSGEVWIYDAAGVFVAEDSLNASGEYRAGGLSAGTYFARTKAAYSEPYADEIYDDLPCPAGACDPATGTPIEVLLGETTGDVDFALERLGTISGTVTDAATGQSIAGRVRVFDASGSSAGLGTIDASGSYTVGRLDAGTYFARTDLYSGDYDDELYDDLPCPNGSCDPTTGTAIEVGLGEPTVGVDFAIDRLGAISGLITEATTGDPVGGVLVTIWSSSGNQEGHTYTDGTGRYTVGQISPGVHFATTESQDYSDELFDDLPCEGSCDPTRGSPIEVATGATTRHVNFALERSGSISGSVTQASTSLPIPGVRVRIWHATGAFAGDASADADGDYRVGGLQPGTYFASTDASDFFDQLYDGLPCGAGCAPTAGTPILVGPHTETPGIDFQLDRLGAISGTVIAAATGEPLSGIRVEIWNESGGRVETDYTGALGDFRVEGLLPGTYFAIADSSVYLNELFDDLPCPGGDCDPTAGTPIPVVLNATTDGVDFALDRLGAISGSVVDDTTGQPLSGVRVEIWNASSVRVGLTTTNGTGEYTFTRLAPGIYYASTENYDDYLDELYDDFPCLAGAPSGCDPDKGTPIPVATATTTEGIDFELIPATTGISGMVSVAASGAPRPNAIVDLWSAAGLHVTSVVTSTSGAYYVGLPPGTYYASTDHGSQDLADEVFDGLLCDGPAYGGHCDPTTGTSIEVEESDLVGIPGVTTGIDFTLEPTVVLFTDAFESGDLSAWSSASGGS